MRFYCLDCETAICSSCTDIEHREHAQLKMAEAVDQEKADLRALIDKAYLQVGRVMYYLNDITVCSMEM